MEGRLWNQVQQLGSDRAVPLSLDPLHIAILPPTPPSLPPSFPLPPSLSLSVSLPLNLFVFTVGILVSMRISFPVLKLISIPRVLTGCTDIIIARKFPL